jgi:hypothetical protein
MNARQHARVVSFSASILKLLYSGNSLDAAVRPGVAWMTETVGASSVSRLQGLFSLLIG